MILSIKMEQIFDDDWDCFCEGFDDDRDPEIVRDEFLYYHYNSIDMTEYEATQFLEEIDFTTARQYHCIVEYVMEKLEDFGMMLEPTFSKIVAQFRYFQAEDYFTIEKFEDLKNNID